MERGEPNADMDVSSGYVFRRPELRDQALTHKSFLNEQGGEPGSDNERLELLGDAVLSLVVTDYLVSRFPSLNEGNLSKLRARLVSEQCLAAGARRIHLGRFLRLGRGEELSEGREKTSLLADALEAVAAAIYLDGGLEASRSFLLRVLEEDLEKLEQQGVGEGTDYKTRLQELCQRQFDELPHYRMAAESGPDHDKRFEIEVRVKGRVLGGGTGRTKKAAEQAAAKVALQRLEEGHFG